MLFTFFLYQLRQYWICFFQKKLQFTKCFHSCYFCLVIEKTDFCKQQNTALLPRRRQFSFGTFLLEIIGFSSSSLNSSKTALNAPTARSALFCYYLKLSYYQPEISTYHRTKTPTCPTRPSHIQTNIEILPPQDIPLRAQYIDSDTVHTQKKSASNVDHIHCTAKLQRNKMNFEGKKITTITQLLGPGGKKIDAVNCVLSL